MGSRTEEILNMSMYVPQFAKGEKLQESHLYELARFSLECSRWATASVGVQGFFAPPVASSRGGRLWNCLEVQGQDNQIVIHPIYLVHEGYPIVHEQGRPVSLNIEGDLLYAKLRVANSSATYREHGYWVDLEWNPNSDGSDLAVVALARRSGPVGKPAFELLPPAWTLDATSELASAHRELIAALTGFRARLVDHGMRVRLGRELLLDRLERLASHPSTANLPVFLADMRLAVRATMGFFYRLRYQGREGTWPGRHDRLADLTGASLEHELARLAPDPKAVALPQVLRQLAEDHPATAAEQVRSIRELTGALRHGGVLWGLLSDDTILPLREVPDARDLMVRVYDCEGAGKSIRVELGTQAGNGRYAFADSKDVPPYLQLLAGQNAGPNGWFTYALPVTDRYLFLSVEKESPVKVYPEKSR
jgi:hypothetical protein